MNDHSPRHNPPTALLPLGAVGLLALLAGRLLGGDWGAWAADLGCTALLAAGTIFFALLIAHRHP